MNTTNKNFTSIRKPAWVAGILGGFVLAIVLLIGTVMARMSDIPEDLDYSTTRLSEIGLFNISYTPSTGPVPVNQMHQWTLKIETVDGQPVENAVIFVDGDMPQHGHGLPTRPQVTEYLGNGNYLVEGVKFQMGGWWVMDFTITANDRTDAVHFNLMLK
jgi:hypothetical protein